MKRILFAVFFIFFAFTSNDVSAQGKDIYSSLNVWGALSIKNPQSPYDTAHGADDSVFVRDYDSGVLKLMSRSEVKPIPQQNNGLVSGGIVTWLHDYIYSVSAATYYINGVLYNSPSVIDTLAPADPLLDRIDMFVLTTNSAAEIITGQPSNPPVSPYYSSNQLYDAIAYVTHNTTSPSCVTTEWIYRENTEWTTDTFSSNYNGNINANNTAFPYQGTKDIAMFHVWSGSYITFASITPPTMSNFLTLSTMVSVFAHPLRSSDKLVYSWYNGSTPVGNPVQVSNGSYGFSGISLGVYQNITIPLTDFGNINGATKLKILMQSNTISGGIAGTIFLDDIQLQANCPQSTCASCEDFALKSDSVNFWSTHGNTGLDSAANFLGTKDGKPIMLRWNNTPMGRLSNTDIILGLNSGLGLVNSTSHGKDAVVIGYNALPLATGNGTVAIGSEAASSLTNDTGCVFVGYRAGKLAVAKELTLIGYESGGNGSITGIRNTGLGYRTLYSITSGRSNNAIGADCLELLTTGNHNTGNGQICFTNLSTGENNTGMGFEAGRYLTIGRYNTLMGVGAGYHMTTSQSTVAIGDSSLYDLRTGINNTSIGSYTNVSDTSLNNTITIGYAATATASNQMMIGNSANVQILTEKISLANGVTWTAPTAISGRGWISADSSGVTNVWADFTFNADGTIYLIQNSTGVVNTDTGNSVAVYDAGSGFVIKNRMVGTRTFKIRIEY